MRKKFGYQAMAAIFAAAMIVSGAGMYQTTAKAAEGQIRTPQQKTAVETQESAKLKAEAASVDPTEDGEYTLTFEAKQEGSDEESVDEEEMFEKFMHQENMYQEDTAQQE